MRHYLVIFFVIVSLALGIGAGLNAKQFIDNSLNARLTVEKEIQR